MDIKLYLFSNYYRLSLRCVTKQAQYVFIHDALNEFITCGDIEIKASSLRAKVNYLSKAIPGKGITDLTINSRYVGDKSISSKVSW